MKNIIPFKKEIIFKTNIEEITSISLEHNLSIENDVVKGHFYINGEYELDDKNSEPFNLDLPFEIVIDEKYNTENAIIDIDDFYYEIVDKNVLSVSIDVLIDKLEEKQMPIIIDEDRCIDETEFDEKEVPKPKEEKLEPKEEIIESKEDNVNLFNNFLNDYDEYVTYNIYVLKDGDTLETIMEKYNTTEDEIKKYNDISNLNVGDKVIVPNNERNK